MNNSKSRFALFFGHRGPFPPELVAGAREEMPRLLKEWGHETIMMPEDATPYGAVASGADGEVYAKFLADNKGKFDGVILCLPNFGDENGAVVGLKDAGVPIFVHGYPDELDMMRPDARRDAFCGKVSITDVFTQYGVDFTVLKPHVVSPTSDRFKKNIEDFNRICRVVNGIRGMVIGAIGARTTPFKTVRFDEVALQRHGITVETLDLSDLFARMKALSPAAAIFKDKREALSGMSCWDEAPDEALENMTRVGVALDAIIEEYKMDAIGLRCWTDLGEQFRICPCMVMGDLNERGIAAACEVDIGNAIAMKALGLAADGQAMCLDWNNNYGEDDDKCILFHCGPVPPSLMAGKGRITDHPMLARVFGKDHGFGPNTGRIAPCNMTFGSVMTDEGRLKMFLGEGRITDDPIASDYFGCAGVAEIKNLQDVLIHMSHAGHRHHVSLAPQWSAAPVKEALERYLGFEVCQPQ